MTVAANFTAKAATARATANVCPSEIEEGYAALRRERNSPHSTERLHKSPEHHEVGVKLDALQAANAERGKAVVVLKVTKAPLHAVGVLTVLKPSSPASSI
jgi:hypothetical protein